ncbi:MAG: S-methyl-5-thioribose-1-phosphate isomerase [Candidatus Dormibacteraeota bacterium]|nr:S-methyl-5-thioribose-1-phosphate isomerase [Candidatus Dormibacteraeota bacterium]
MSELRPAVDWREDGLEIIDQTLLPARLEIRRLASLDAVVEAIATLAVRGAPAIGVTAAFGLVVAIDERRPQGAAETREVLRSAAARLAAARPTAVNLSWAVERVRWRAEPGTTAAEIRALALAAAQAIQAQDREACRRIGEHGRRELGGLRRLLTHCNTGRLATAGWGTALGIVYAKVAAGEPVEVLASESRPLLQGARLTAWELADAGVPVTLLADGAVATALAAGRADAVVVGCDRVARNGDVANKIGTYSHALAARAAGVPFYVAGPLSSFDPACPTGAAIVIEERSPEEVRVLGGQAIAPPVDVFNPAFDVTPAALITAFITDAGILRPPFESSIGQARRAAVPAPQP